MPGCYVMCSGNKIRYRKKLCRALFVVFQKGTKLKPRNIYPYYSQHCRHWKEREKKIQFFLFSDVLSSCLFLSTQLNMPFTECIVHIYFFCRHNCNRQFQYLKTVKWRFVMEEKASSLLCVELWPIHVAYWQLPSDWLQNNKQWRQFSLVFTVLRERL